MFSRKNQKLDTNQQTLILLLQSYIFDPNKKTEESLGFLLANRKLNQFNIQDFLTIRDEKEWQRFDNLIDRLNINVYHPNQFLLTRCWIPIKTSLLISGIHTGDCADETLEKLVLFYLVHARDQLLIVQAAKKKQNGFFTKSREIEVLDTAIDEVRNKGITQEAAKTLEDMQQVFKANKIAKYAKIIGYIVLALTGIGLLPAIYFANKMRNEDTTTAQQQASTQIENVLKAAM